MMLVPALASAVSPALAQLAKVEGRVCDAAAETAIGHAKVYLCGASDHKTIPRCAMTTADGAGRFAFAERQPGRYHVRVEADGYLSDFLIQDGRGTAEFDLHGGDRKNANVRLWREATIKGRVLDELGRPMSGIDVAAIVEIFEGGRRYLSRTRDASIVSTNEKGEFQISQLRPGRYFLEAFSGRSTQRTRSIWDQGRLPVYFPNATAITAAAALCVDAGRENVIQFRLTPRSTYQVRGKLSFPSGSKRDFEPLVAVRDEKGDLIRGYAFQYDHKSERFMLGRLPSGSYEVELRTGMSDTDLVARREFILRDSDIDDLLMPIQSPLQVQAFIRFPTGFSPSKPYSVRVRLERDGVPLRDESGWPITHAGEVTLPPHLAPGHYRLYLFGEDPIYLRAAGIGGRDVLTQGLLLDSDTTDMLDLRIDEANSTISGRVVRVSEIPGGAADVKLIAQGASSPYVAKSVNTDRAGRFRIEGVAPGRYNLIALDQIVRDTEFGPTEWNQVKQRAASIEVLENTTLDVELKPARLVYVRPPCGELAGP